MSNATNRDHIATKDLGRIKSPPFRGDILRRYRGNLSGPTIATKCPDCGHATWTTDVDALTRILDVEPLDLVGELKAKIFKLNTFQIGRSGSSFWAVRRVLHHLLAGGHDDRIILAEHNCLTATATEHPTYFPRISYTQTEEPQF